MWSQAMPTQQHTCIISSMETTPLCHPPAKNTRKDGLQRFILDFGWGFHGMVAHNLSMFSITLKQTLSVFFMLQTCGSNGLCYKQPRQTGRLKDKIIENTLICISHSTKDQNNVIMLLPHPPNTPIQNTYPSEQTTFQLSSGWASPHWDHVSWDWLELSNKHTWLNLETMLLSSPHSVLFHTKSLHVFH